MALFYEREVVPPSGGIRVVELIAMSPVEGVPPRPTPEPPRPTHPIALPGDDWWGQDLHPSHPIALPGDPWWPTTPPTPGTPPAGTVAIVRPVPEGTTPPAAPPADATVMQIVVGRGSLPTFAWVAPYASTGPVEPPA